MGHSLTIIGTIAREGASDPDYGRYTCEVCEPGENRGEERCHNSTTTLFIAGTPPQISVRGKRLILVQLLRY